MFHGWKVVGVAFLVALYGWGFGFYGVGVFVAALQERHGWSASSISAAVTLYYLLGGTLILFAGGMFERLGPRRVVLTGMLCMGVGAIALTWITAIWQVYAAFMFMAVGWACTSGAALNLIVAPWFEKKRGQAVSLAFNGASFGGIAVAPLLLFAIAHLGFEWGVTAVCLALAALLAPLVLIVMHRGPEVLGLGPDGGPAIPVSAKAADAPRVSRWAFLHSLHFWTVSTPFALALMAQVGFITHQVSYLKPLVGLTAAGWLVSATTVGAVAGRFIVAAFVDRVSRRAVAAGNFVMQGGGVALLLMGTSPVFIFAGCILFGLGVGNTTSLPSLIVQMEFPKAAFGAIIGAVIAINQFTYSLGPSLLGWLRDWHGDYTLSLGACVVLYLTASVLVMLRPAHMAPQPALSPQEPR